MLMRVVLLTDRVSNVFVLKAGAALRLALAELGKWRFGDLTPDTSASEDTKKKHDACSN
jgi:hypothetical protein